MFADVSLCSPALMRNAPPRSQVACAARPAKLEAAALDQAQFELIEKQLQFDAQVGQVHLKALQSTNVAQYVTKRSWRIKRDRAAADAVVEMLNRRTLIIEADKGAATGLSEFGKFQEGVNKTHGGLASDAVFTIV